MFKWAKVLSTRGWLPVNFVEGNNEGSFPLLEEVNTLNCLGLESLRYIDHEDSNIAQRRTSVAQVTKRLVAGCVDDKQSWEPQAGRVKLQGTKDVVCKQEATHLIHSYTFINIIVNTVNNLRRLRRNFFRKYTFY